MTEDLLAGRFLQLWGPGEWFYMILCRCLAFACSLLLYGGQGLRRPGITTLLYSLLWMLIAKSLKYTLFEIKNAVFFAVYTRSLELCSPNMGRINVHATSHHRKQSVPKAPLWHSRGRLVCSLKMNNGVNAKTASHMKVNRGFCNQPRSTS